MAGPHVQDRRSAFYKISAIEYESLSQYASVPLVKTVLAQSPHPDPWSELYPYSYPYWLLPLYDDQKDPCIGCILCSLDQNRFGPYYWRITSLYFAQGCQNPGHLVEQALRDVSGPGFLAFRRTKDTKWSAGHIAAQIFLEGRWERDYENGSPYMQHNLKPLVSFFTLLSREVTDWFRLLSVFSLSISCRRVSCRLSASRLPLIPPTRWPL
jgi:hypothetical protein